MSSAREEKKETSPVIKPEDEINALRDYFSEIYVRETQSSMGGKLEMYLHHVGIGEDIIRQLYKDKDYFLKEKDYKYFLQEKTPEERLDKIKSHITMLAEIDTKIEAEYNRRRDQGAFRILFSDPRTPGYNAARDLNQNFSSARQYLGKAINQALQVQKIYTKFFTEQKEFEEKQEEKAYLDCNNHIIEFINENLLAIKLGKKTEYSKFTIPDRKGKPHQVAKHIFEIYDAAGSDEYKTEKDRHQKIISLCNEKLGANKRVWEQIYEKIIKANGDPAKLKSELDDLKIQMDAAASMKKTGGLFSRKPKKDKPKVIAQDSREAEKKGFGSSAYNFIKEKIKRTPKPAASDTPTSRPSPTRRDSKS